MKLKVLFSAALIGSMALVSCNNSGSKAKALGEFSNITDVDSVSYLYGEMNSQSYWRLAQTDTTMNEDKAREAYLQGVEKALEMIAGQDKAYIKGLMQGLEIASSLEPAAESLGTELNTKMVLEGLKYGLTSDTVLNTGTANSDFQRLVSRMQKQKLEKEEAAAKQALNDFVAKEKYNKIDSTLYEKVLAPGNGEELINAESEVECTVNFTTVDGKTVNVPGLSPKLRVAQYLGTPLGNALLRMKAGETASFATTGATMFSNSASRFGVKGSDVLLFKVSVGNVTKAELPTQTLTPQP